VDGLNGIIDLYYRGHWHPEEEINAGNEELGKGWEKPRL